MNRPAVTPLTAKDTQAPKCDVRGRYQSAGLHTREGQALCGPHWREHEVRMGRRRAVAA